MNWSLFYIILLFFFLGGIGIYFAGKKQNSTERKKNRIKYITYFFIVIFLYGCICFIPNIFPWVCLSIVFAGLIELVRIQRNNPKNSIVFYLILWMYALVSVGFYFFSCLSQPVLLYTLFTVCTFDAFCQIAGQLFGKHKICPRISPNKTYEGLYGGLFMSVCTFFITGTIMGFFLLEAIMLGLGICLFSFAGDLAASCIKRVYGVKDFSSALSEHGGFLDRFDSFIVAGTFIYLVNLFFKIS
ncbi:phosphatidate cytidylyltransferase [Viscerimonas tarda]